MKTILTIFAAMMMSAATVNAQQLVTYPAPFGAELNDEFTVSVRQEGGEWQDVPSYAMKVDDATNGTHQPVVTSVAYFDFEGTVEVMVTKNRGEIQSHRVRPLSYDITSTSDGKSIRFRLDRPRNLSVEVNGDIFNNLQLFTNPIDTNRPKKLKDKNLVYFGPGIHKLEGDSLHVKSGQTVYVAGGAIVEGWFSTYKENNIRILGRGIIIPGRHEGIMVRYSKNVKVDGLITTQVPVGESEDVSITNTKVLSYYGWGDGFNVFASNNVRYDNIFARTSDDCCTIYCTRLGYRGDSRNITFRNAVFWADVAHPIMIGLHGDADRHDVVDGALFEHIDILDQNEHQIDYMGCIGINVGDNNSVRNVTFDDIHIESLRKGMLFNIRMCYNKKYCKAPGLAIDNILLRNVRYDGATPCMSIIAGYDDSRRISGITFENLTINGKVITDDMEGKPAWWKTADMAGIFVGEHVEGLVFKK